MDNGERFDIIERQMNVSYLGMTEGINISISDDIVFVGCYSYHSSTVPAFKVRFKLKIVFLPFYC